MSRRIRLGFIAMAIPVLMLAGFGLYSLAGPVSSGNASPLSGIPLVRPAFAQGSATLPDPNAGISAYFQVTPIMMDFDEVAKGFDVMISAGNNYIIGSTP